MSGASPRESGPGAPAPGRSPASTPPAPSLTPRGPPAGPAAAAPRELRCPSGPGGRGAARAGEGRARGAGRPARAIQSAVRSGGRGRASGRAVSLRGRQGQTRHLHSQLRRLWASGRGAQNLLRLTRFCGVPPIALPTRGARCPRPGAACGVARETARLGPGAPGGVPAAKFGGGGLGAGEMAPVRPSFCPPVAADAQGRTGLRRAAAGPALGSFGGRGRSSSCGGGGGRAGPAPGPSPRPGAPAPPRPAAGTGRCGARASFCRRRGRGLEVPSALPRRDRNRGPFSLWKDLC